MVVSPVLCALRVVVSADEGPILDEVFWGADAADALSFAIVAINDSTNNGSHNGTQYHWTNYEVE